MSELFDIKELEKTVNHCRDCAHIMDVRCNTRIIKYCSVVKSNQTANGMKKVKGKTEACKYFKKN